MSTKERLALDFEKAGHPELAERARSGEFDDYESELFNPIMTLVGACRDAGLTTMLEAAMNGEYDATHEEAENWWRRDGRFLLNGKP